MAQVMYADEFEIQKIVEQFERCELALAEFTHARHLTVACWYLCTLPCHEALGHMRRGLQRFIAHHQKQGYHETITRFWMELLCSDLCQSEGATITVKINGAIERFGDKDILYSYYTRDCVMSDAARAAWVEPDLRAIAAHIGSAVTAEPSRSPD